MGKPKIAPNRGMGRPKGATNLISRAAKEAIEMAAEGLGGVDRLVAWAKADERNERIFWSQIYTKLLPLQVNASVEVNPIQTLFDQVAENTDRIGKRVN